MANINWILQYLKKTQRQLSKHNKCIGTNVYLDVGVMSARLGAFTLSYLLFFQGFLYVKVKQQVFPMWSFPRVHGMEEDLKNQPHPRWHSQ